ncbi:Uncharacterised protein [Mycobacterium tuberculosis]|uniref:Uncharacterized protein n=1 Tax=Mycobacterium tuberculosis TaxID=1773 RepID=A0A654TE68_MYCTX|nr:Uncharacterised protein [Mycobacterium tuberculosis]CKQ92381.1 Uncharacterised protein [Mycobacterium tuberculosis]
MVTKIAAREISNLVRNSVRWSTSDIVASGLTRLRLLRGLSRLRRPAARTEATPELSRPSLGAVLTRRR